MTADREGCTESIAALHVIIGLLVFLALPAVVAWQVWTSGEGDRDGARSGAASEGAPTVLMIVLDGVEPIELRQLALQGTGMPHVADLARESAWFDRNYAQCNGTNAAFASLLTGHHARNHGVGSLRDLGRQRLSSAATTLAEDLAASGFRTVAAVSLPQLGAELSGFAQGFGAYDGPSITYERVYRPATETVHALHAQLADVLRSAEPVFALVHLADARRPEDPAPAVAAPIIERHLAPFRASMLELDEALGSEGGAASVVREVRKSLSRRRGHAAWDALQSALHEAELAVLDREIGRTLTLLRESGRYANALIVLVGNTGREWRSGEKEGPFGSFPLHRYHVPLLIRFPDHPRSQQVHALTSSIDVRATVLDVIGASRGTATASDGESLTPLVVPGEGRRATLRESILLEDSALGLHAAIDDFWFVASLPGSAPIWLTSEREVDAPGEIAPVPRAQLERTRELVARFGSPARLSVELLPGSSSSVEVELDAYEGEWFRGELTGGRVLSGSEQTWFIRPRDEVEVELAAAGGAGVARLDLESDTRAMPFRVALALSTGELDESLVRIGDRALDRLPAPRIPDERADDWPEDANGEPAALDVDVVHESGRWFRISVGGDYGRSVRLLITKSPFDGLGTRSVIERSGGFEVEPVRGRRDVLVVRGTTPLSVRVQKSAASDLALSVAIEGAQVPVARMRYKGKRFAQPGEITFALPDWLPGVTEHLEAPIDRARLAPTPGTILIHRPDSARYPAEAADVPAGDAIDRAREELLDFLRRLEDPE